jgi:cytochrome c oxidase subunit II
MSTHPLNFLSGAGERADRIVPLTWYTLWVSIIVCVVIGALLLIAVSRAHRPTASLRDVPVARGASGIRWITTGLIVSAVPLVIALVWTMVTLRAVAGPPANPGLVLDVTGHQWWWEVKYDSPNPSEVFETANEIHIPIGVRVLVRLHGGDVIHSFWVPQLTGKTDTIPGQVNLSWLEADRPGRYLGQCTEFCGFQHAHMQFEVVAESPEDFQRWLAHQREPAPEPVTSEAKSGQALVEYRCGLCHQVRGTQAAAVAAPDLTHLVGRRTLAAGTLLNNPGNLEGWIQNPQNLKPGNLMPNQWLSAEELTETLAYLETLK